MRQEQANEQANEQGRTPLTAYPVTRARELVEGPNSSRRGAASWQCEGNRDKFDQDMGIIEPAMVITSLGVLLPGRGAEG